MVSQENLQKLASILQNGGEDGLDEKLKNIASLLEGANVTSGENEEELLKKLLTSMLAASRTKASNYDYLLFVGVVTLIATIFGEKISKRKYAKKQLIDLK